MRKIAFGLLLVISVSLAAGAGCPGSGDPTVSLSLDQDTIDMNGGVAYVTATADSISLQPVTVRLSYGGTAVSGKDYTRSSMTITIPPWQTSGNVRISGIADASNEGDCTVITQIVSVTNGTAGEPSSVTLTLAADPSADPLTVALSLADATGAAIDGTDGSLGEDGGQIQVVATLSAAAHRDVTLDLGLAGTAVKDTNYTVSGTQITIPAGKTTGSVTFTGRKVDGYNNGLTIQVTIASLTGAAEEQTDGAGQQLTISLADSEAAPTVTLAVSPATLNENGGVATVTATLSKAIQVDATILVAFGGPAEKDTNYTASASQIVIPAGQTTGTLTLTAKDDGIYKGDLAIQMQAGTPQNATLSGDGALSATIKESLPAPSVSLDPKTFVLDEKGGTATLSATLSSAVGLDTTVSLSSAGTATSGADYTISANQITIPAGQLVGTVTLTGVDDTVYEGTETIKVSITGAANGVTIAGGAQEAVGSLQDSLQPPKVTLSVSESLFAEAGGTSLVVATLSNKSYQKVTINVTFSGQASQATDYTASDTKIEIPAGELSGAITLTGAGNTALGGPKTITAGITTASVTNGTVPGGAQEATTTVTDAPTVTLSLAGSPMSEDGGTATVSAALSQAIGTALTITFTPGGTAALGTDYTIDTTSIAIPAGATTGSNVITLTGKASLSYDPDKTIVLSAAPLPVNPFLGSRQVTAVVAGDTPEQYKAKGEKWLADNAKLPDIVVLPSGLQYKVINAGAGQKPKAADRVFVKYKGTLIDGSVFDSSDGIAFGVTDVIDGWEEALQLMPLNAKWMLYIPYNLAYKEKGSAPKIPPYAALIFEVELLGIEVR